MTAYTHRERVIATFNHQEADRIPLDLMGNASMLLDNTYFRLRDHLGLSPIPPVRSGTTANYYDERILERFDIDFRRLFLKKLPNRKAVVHTDGTHTDAWGIRYQPLGLTVNPVGHPLSHVQSVEDVEAYDWPVAKELFATEGLEEQARRMYKDTDYALVARNPISEGFLDRLGHLMGLEQLYISLITMPDVVKCMIARLLEIYRDIYDMFLGAVGQYVEMVEFGDDLGGQNNLLIAPDMYREFIKPAHAELFGLIHEKAPRAALFYHTDGAVFDLIPDLIEAGVNVLNPVQTSASGMGAARLKEIFGNSLVFHGAIEGTEGEVGTSDIAAEVRQRIDVLAPEGGYVLSTCNHMMDVRAENIVAMYATAREYGRYAK